MAIASKIRMKPAGVVAGKLHGFPERQGMEFYLVTVKLKEAEGERGKRSGAKKASKKKSTGSFASTTFVQRNGEFRAEGLRPGVYSLELQRRITGGESQPTEEKFLLGEVEVKAGEVKNVEFDMPAIGGQPVPVGGPSVPRMVQR